MVYNRQPARIQPALSGPVDHPHSAAPDLPEDPVDPFGGAGKTTLVGDGDEGAQHVGVDARVDGQLINL